LLRLAKSGATGRREVQESGNAAVLLRHAAAGDEAAARALLLLSLDGDDTRVGLVADGVVDALSFAATSLTSLATVDVNKCIARSGNPHAMEQAVVVLNWICSESNELALEAIKLGAFQLCETIVNYDNCNIAKNAVELARTLETA
ncbi:hypothetical protein BAE44_0012136, partial [Dichanthelium oligosanthes]